MKRLAVFTDGTWNDEEDRTNVHTLHEWVAPTSADGTIQLKKYVRGVGTKPMQKLLGGAVGEGLSSNGREGYQWLRDHYTDGDQIFLFGFSRGAYTARSIAGLIATCGLVRRNAPISVEWIYERYRDRKNKAIPIWKLEHIRATNERELTAGELSLLDHSRRVDIHMIGVWDTVGALGIPWTGMPLFGKQEFFFHNPNLSVIHKHAYQALAIDEHRGAYKPTLWTQFVPAERSNATISEPSLPDVSRCEQRWFAGAHSNVGGGYKEDLMCLRPLAWLQGQAERLGLAFTQTVAANTQHLGCKPVDSYGKFMFGVYRVIRLGRRFFRPIGVRRNKVKGGWSYPINESIDESVFDRCRGDSKYARDNLNEWATRNSFKLAELRGVQAGYKL